MVLNVVVEFLHELAAVAWIGGIIYANLILMPAISVVAGPERGKLLGAVAKRFTILSWLSILVLIITGIVKGLSPEMAESTPTEHLTMLVKYALFAGMVLVGVLITFVLSPKMKKLAPKPGEKPASGFAKVQKQIATLAFVNMILGVLVLLVLAWL